MEKIKKDLETGKMERLYLLTGSEPFLIRMMKKKFIHTLCGGMGGMGSLNLVWYKDAEQMPLGTELVKECKELPMFGEYRLVIIDCKMKSDDDFTSFLSNIPEQTVIVIVQETELDKRGKMYKAVKKYGYICECNSYSRPKLEDWVIRAAAHLGIQADRNAASCLIEYSGEDMNTLANELAKLSMVTSRLTDEVIKKYCFPLIENQIFKMIENAINGNVDAAARQYEELKILKEAPFKILSLINRQLKIDLTVAAGKSNSDGALAKMLGVPPFAIKKSRKCKLSQEQLQSLLEEGIFYEHMIKAGKIPDNLAVELFLTKIAK